MSAILSIILMLLVIEILILTQIGLPLLVSILLYSLTFTTILRESTRKRKQRLTLQNSVQIRNQQARRISLIQSSVQYIIQQLITILASLIARTPRNFYLTSIAALELVNYMLLTLLQLICRLKLEPTEAETQYFVQPLLVQLLTLLIVKPSTNSLSCLLIVGETSKTSRFLPYRLFRLSYLESTTLLLTRSL